MPLIIISYLCRVRIPPKHVFYYRCPDHRKNYVLSFVFCFDREDDVYQFSYCFPYSYTRLQNYLDTIEKRNMDFFQRELLCLSVVSFYLRHFVMLTFVKLKQGSNFTTATTANAVTSSAFAVMPFKFGF